jgi:DNA-binding MarR family transcriptional regulator
MSSDNPRGHLAFLIHDVAKRLRQEFGRRAARIELTLSQARCLVFLAVRPGASLKALASALEVQPMSVLRVVDGLEQRKMLRRETDPADRRALKLFLTKAGEAGVERVWQALDEIVADACAGMSSSDRKTLKNSLMSLSNGMQVFDIEEK